MNLLINSLLFVILPDYSYVHCKHTIQCYNFCFTQVSLEQLKAKWIFFSVQFSLSVASDSLRPHGLQHTRLPCPSPSPRAYSNSCPLSRWCHPTISSSVIPFPSCSPFFPASGSFPMSRLFSSGGAKVLELQLKHQSFQWIFRIDFL